jgi:hypothetical protein
LGVRGSGEDQYEQGFRGEAAHLLIMVQEMGCRFPQVRNEGYFSLKEIPS